MARNAVRLSPIRQISDNRMCIQNDDEGRLTLYQRGESTHWYADIKLPGRPRRQIALGTADVHRAISEARRHFRGLLYRVEKGEPAREPSVSDVAACWLQELETQQNKGEITASKLDTIKSNLSSLLPYFGKIGISQVHESDVASYRQHRKRAGTEKSRLLTYELGNRTIVKRRPSHHVKPVKDATINRQFTTLRGVFNYAVLHRIVDRVRVPKLPSMNVKGDPGTWFSVDEYKQLRRSSWQRVCTAASIGERYHRALLHWYIVFMVISGLRPAEINNACWGHIAPLSEPRARGGAFRSVTISVRAKGKSRETVPPPSIVAVLDKLKALQERALGRPVIDSDRLFPATDEAISRAFKRLLVSAKLLTNRFGQTRTPTSLRHSSLSFVLLCRHWLIHDVALWAGTSVKMIEQHYSALTPRMVAARRGRTELRPRWR